MSGNARIPSRRQILKHGAAACAAVAMSSAKVATATNSSSPIPRRPLGRTGLEVSIIGVGGFSLGNVPYADEAIQIVHEAVDAGVNYFETAWEYQEGKSEERLGEALRGRRENVILTSQVCTHGRDKTVAMRQLEESLKRLKTDHLDLWLIHECIYWNDPDRHFASGGVIEALDEAKKQGKVRFVGFSGHKDPQIHLDMLAKGYTFDAAYLPLNPFDGTYRSFEKRVLPELDKQKIAALGVKSLGGDGSPVIKGAVTAEEALRYAMSLPVATTITGIDSLAVLQQNLDIAHGFEPWSPSQMQALRDRCGPLAADGHFELYKTTKKFDMEVGREQHDFPPRAKLPL